MSYLITGLVLGSVWAIVASGIVVTYSTTGVLNLGYGSFAYALAECFFVLRTYLHWSGWLSAVVTVGAIAPALGFLLWATIFRKLEGAGTVPTIVSTIGLAIALPALVLFIFPNQQVFVAPGVIDDGARFVRFLGTSLSYNQIACLAGALACAVGLGVMLRFTRSGLVMRAVVNRPSVAELMGVNTRLASALSWIIGCQLAAIGGILLAPLLALNSSIFVELTVVSLSVALAAGLRSLLVVYAAALALGMASSWLTQFASAGSVLLSGLRPGLAFLLIVVVLLLRRTPLTKAVERPVSITRRARFTTREFGMVGGLGLVAIVIAPVVLNGYWLGVAALGLTYGLIFLAFTAALGRTGVLSMGQTAIVGIAAFTTGAAATDLGIPLFGAMAVGGLAACLLGAILAWIGTRLGLLEFGLLTLGFGVLADEFLFHFTSFVPLTGYVFAPSGFFGITIGSNMTMFFFTAACFAIGALLLGFLQSRTIGLYMEALDLNREVAEHTGVATRRHRVAMFALSSFVVGIGGCELALYQQHIGLQDVTTYTGLVWLAVLVTFGRRSITAALVAGLVYAFLPAILQRYLPLRYGEVPVVLFGLGGLSLASDPRGIVATWHELLGKLKEFGLGRLRTAVAGGGQGRV